MHIARPLGILPPSVGSSRSSLSDSSSRRIKSGTNTTTENNSSVFKYHVNPPTGDAWNRNSPNGKVGNGNLNPGSDLSSTSGSSIIGETGATAGETSGIIVSQREQLTEVA